MRRTLAVLTALILAASPAIATPTCGDVNDNSVVNVLDALMVAQFSAGTVVPTAEQIASGDVNSNGSLDLLDALRVLQMAAGLPVTFNCTLGGPEMLYIATGYPGQLQVVDEATAVQVGIVNLPGDPVSIAADPTRERLYISYGTSSVGVLDTTTDTLLPAQSAPGLTGAITVTPDGSALVGLSSTGVIVIDLPGFTVRHNIATGIIGGWGSGYVTVSPDSQFAWTTDTYNNTAIKVDIVAGTLAGSVVVGNSPYGIDVSNDGSKVFVINHGDQTLSRIDTATGLELLPRQPVGIYPMAVLGHTNGSAMAVNCISGNVTQHDPSTGQQTRVFGVGQEPVEIYECESEDMAVINTGSSFVSLVDSVSGVARQIASLGYPVDVSSK
jgi:DNA-binding beta-propeller fold protein YncE